MTRVDFYLEADDPLSVACRLAAKAVQQQLRVVMYAPSGEVAHAVDQMLWTTPPLAFVPHCMAEHRLAAETPVLVARGDTEAMPHDDVLVNLHDEWPPSFARFQRLIEIVSRDDDDKQNARARFRFYKDRGYLIQTHNLAERKRA